MWEFLAEYGLFLAKALTVVGALLLLLVAAVGARERLRGDEDGHLEVRRLNERYEGMRDAVRGATLAPREQRRLAKEARRARKAAAGAARPRVYVLDFHGDIRAQAVQSLREEVSAVIAAAVEGDRVLLRLESSGGMVHAYGLAAAQLERLREARIPLLACVDKVAASGGYLMACVAERIVAAPFAVLGSIGVVAQVPNLHRLLRRHDIDYELFTAGEFKRTVTVFGRNTEAGRQKFLAELEETHALFRDYVRKHRPALDVATVATGETWFGTRALELGLVDGIGTSDAWLQAEAANCDLLEVRHVARQPLSRRLGLAVEGVLAGAIGRAIEGASRREDWYR